MKSYLYGRFIEANDQSSWQREEDRHERITKVFRKRYVPIWTTYKDDPVKPDRDGLTSASRMCGSELREDRLRWVALVCAKALFLKRITFEQLFRKLGGK